MNYPRPAYPLDFDTEHTLFRVYNNTQSVLTADLGETSTKISVEPSVWPENGFATLPGELVYYDGVEKTADGNVKTLKKCVRAVEGVAKDHSAGTAIYGMVVAQTHNQLVQAVIELERVVGDLSNSLNKTPRDMANFFLKRSEPEPSAFGATGLVNSLHAATSSLLSAPAANDDVCPDIQFEFNVAVPVPGGVRAEYCLRIFPYDSTTTGFTINFGDGTQTTTELQGTHQFATGGPYTPSAQIVTPNCTLVVQPSTPNSGTDITPSVTPAVPFHIQIPDAPQFPSFVYPRRICPGPLFNLPPIITPSMCCSPSCSPSNCSVSAISTICCPSIISIVGCCPPSVISVSMPSITVNVNWGKPPTVPVKIICPDTKPPPTNYIGRVQGDFPIGYNGNIPMTNFTTPPQIGWVIGFRPGGPVYPIIGIIESPGLLEFQLGIPLTEAIMDGDLIFYVDPIALVFIPDDVYPIGYAAEIALSDYDALPADGDEIVFSDDLSNSYTVVAVDDAQGTITLDRPLSAEVADKEGVYLLSHLFGMANPFAMSGFQDAGGGPNIPVTFNENIGIPEEIKIIPPAVPLPAEIRIVGDIPNTIRLDTGDMPRQIDVKPVPDFPSTITVDMPEEIRIVGMPSVIEVNVPPTIQLVMPENPQVELVYKGEPFELKPSPELENLLSRIILAR